MSLIKQNKDFNDEHMRRSTILLEKIMNDNPDTSHLNAITCSAKQATEELLEEYAKSDIVLKLKSKLVDELKLMSKFNYEKMIRMTCKKLLNDSAKDLAPDFKLPYIHGLYGKYIPIILTCSNITSFSKLQNIAEAIKNMLEDNEI